MQQKKANPFESPVGLIHYGCPSCIITKPSTTELSSHWLLKFFIFHAIEEKGGSPLEVFIWGKAFHLR